MRSPGTSSRPVINIPAQILTLSVLLVFCFLVSEILSPEPNDKLFRLFALFPDRYFSEGKIQEGWITALWSLFTYSFLHRDWSHLLFNLAWLIVFGSIVARYMGTARFFLFYSFCAFGAALVYILINLGSGIPAIGASGAVFGIFGALVRFLLPGDYGGLVQSQPFDLKETLKNPRVLTIVSVILGIDILFALARGITGYGSIAWEAHLGGFFTGLLFFGMFGPPLRSASGGPGRVNYGEWR